MGPYRKSRFMLLTRQAPQMADRVYVMESGRIALEGAATDLLHDAEVRRVYLGG